MPRISQKALLWVLLTFSTFLLRTAGQAPAKTPGPPPTLGLEKGIKRFDTPDFKIGVANASLTLPSLQPQGADGFDFTPADLLEARSKDGFYHLGDIQF